MSIELNGTTKIRASELNDQTISVLQPKNWIINGGFDVWQRGTSQTSDGYGSDDRWVNSNWTSTKTNSRQTFTLGQTEVPNNPTYFSRTVVSSVAGAGNYAYKAQKIEDVSKLAGKTVSFSFWAKADSVKNISIEWIQNFGTGGSASVTALSVQKKSLTSSWQKITITIILPSISGKTVGEGSNTQITIWFDAGSNFNSRTDSLGNQSGTFDIANVSLVEGSVPVEWQTEAYADVLRQCQRYGEPLAVGGGALSGVRYVSGTLFWWFFKTPKRVPPTLKGNTISTSFGSGSNQANIYNTSTGTMLTGTSVIAIFEPNQNVDRVILNINATSLSGSNGNYLSLDLASNVLIFADSEL